MALMGGCRGQNCRSSGRRNAVFLRKERPLSQWHIILPALWREELPPAATSDRRQRRVDVHAHPRYAHAPPLPSDLLRFLTLYSWARFSRASRMNCC